MRPWRGPCVSSISRRRRGRPLTADLIVLLVSISSSFVVVEAFLVASKPALFAAHKIRHAVPLNVSRLQVAEASIPPLETSNAEIQIEEKEKSETTLDDGSKVLFAVLARSGYAEPFCQGVLAEPVTTTQDVLSRRKAVITPLSGPDAIQDALVVEGAVRVLDSLLLQHLVLERKDETCATAEFGIRINSSNSHDVYLLKQALQTRGYVPCKDEDNGAFCIEYGNIVRAYSELAMNERGTELGLTALEILGLLSCRRISYQLSPDASTTTSHTRNVVAVQRDLLPKEVTDNILDIMADIEAKGWLSTNLDSVDNLPSLHLNLVSGGEPIFKGNDVDTSTATFEGSVMALWLLVKTHLENKLLPRVREIMGSPTVELSDVFIRRYGEDIQPDHDAATRYGISAHFDVTASTTSVIALDDVAAEGKSGLYTMESSDASNHAALRRYFPLSAGDAVVHTWDVLHGVEIDPGQSRTSLIVWFEDRGQVVKDDLSEEATGSPTNAPAYPPWLAHPSTEDDIKTFVLATATSSSADDISIEKGTDDGTHPHNLYILSAGLGNAFALTSLGTLCSEGELSPECLSKVNSMVKGSKGFERNDDSEIDANEMAVALWTQGAMKGNPLAQASLADEYMARSMEAMQDKNVADSNELRLKAVVLFALAAQQGYDDAIQALPRVLDVEASLYDDAEEFYKSPVFHTAQVAMLVGSS